MTCLGRMQVLHENTNLIQKSLSKMHAYGNTGCFKGRWKPRWVCLCATDSKIHTLAN